jgi:hypothetical protein
LIFCCFASLLISDYGFWIQCATNLRILSFRVRRTEPSGHNPIRSLRSKTCPIQWHGTSCCYAEVVHMYACFCCCTSAAAGLRGRGFCLSVPRLWAQVVMGIKAPTTVRIRQQSRLSATCIYPLSGTVGRQRLPKCPALVVDPRCNSAGYMRVNGSERIIPHSGLIFRPQLISPQFSALNV